MRRMAFRPTASVARLVFFSGVVLAPTSLFPTDEKAASGDKPEKAEKPSPATHPALKVATSAELDAFLDAWAAKMRETKSMAIQFRQEKKLRILRRPRVSEGDLVYEDGKLSVVVRGKDSQVESQLLLKDGELRILYPQLKRLEVIPLGGSGGKAGQAPLSSAGPSIPFFAGDPRDARKDYDVRLARGETEDLLTLEPRDKSLPIQRLELKLVAHELKEYRQIETNGDELRMEILSTEKNPKIRPERFLLQVPEGTTEVRPTGK